MIYDSPNGCERFDQFFRGQRRAISPSWQTIVICYEYAMKAKVEVSYGLLSQLFEKVLRGLIIFSVLILLLIYIKTLLGKKVS